MEQPKNISPEVKNPERNQEQNEQKEERKLSETLVSEQKEQKKDAQDKKVPLLQDKKKEIKPKKTEAFVRTTLAISRKHGVALSNLVKGKNIEKAVESLNEVISMKKALSMKGEIGHKKGMMSGKYPVKDAKEFLKLVRNLGTNASNLGIDTAAARIHSTADTATRRKFGRYKGKSAN